MMMLEDEENN